MRLCSLYKILYPKRRIYSYSILGAIVSPNKIPLNWRSVFTSCTDVRGGGLHDAPKLLGQLLICFIRNMGGCQNYGPLLNPYYNAAPTI